jgi:hypothetical protein
LRKAINSVISKSRLATRKDSIPNGKTSIKFFENLYKILNFLYNLTAITVLYIHQYTCSITSRSSLLRMRNVSDKTRSYNQNTHFISSNFFFANYAVYEVIWKNIVERVRPQMTIWRMRCASILLCVSIK